MQLKSFELARLSSSSLLIQSSRLSPKPQSSTREDPHDLQSLAALEVVWAVGSRCVALSDEAFKAVALRERSPAPARAWPVGRGAGRRASG